ncbi:MAG TPA: YIP1 family protein [Chthoniobacterales bacterium]
MATIHVARDGTNIGTFSIEEVREGLRTGRFLPTDMAWEAGMPDWRPLSQVVAGKPAAATPASGAPGTNALAVSPSSSSSGAAASGGGLPWEHREQLGMFKAYFDTVSMVLTKPGEAFAMMKTEGDMMGPMLFALIGGSAGMIVSLLLQIALHSIGFMADRQSAMFGLGIAGVWTLGYIVLIPVIVIVGMFVGSGILHLCLMIVGGANKPFETTFRVVCFSSGSTYLLSMIPFCGGMIAGVWNIVLECIGLARAHETDTGKAVMAVLLPIIVCCGGMILLGILGGFSALSLFQKH